jgi:hypothetical protein
MTQNRSLPAGENSSNEEAGPFEPAGSDGEDVVVDCLQAAVVHAMADRLAAEAALP